MVTTTLVFYFLLLITSTTLGSHLNRRILHQPFFPLATTPPSPDTDTPQQQQQQQPPFFPSYPSSSPPPSNPNPTPNPSPFASFPANISSLILPHSPSSSSHRSVSPKLLALTISLSLLAASLAAISLFLFFRRRRSRPPNNKPPAPPTTNSTNHTRSTGSGSGSGSGNGSVEVNRGVPKLRNPGAPNSSEFLYLGTLASSAALDDDGQGRARKLDSPELQPLPPLIGRQHWRNDDQDEFYSPRGSVSGRETGSDSTRVFSNVIVGGGAQVNDANRNSEGTTSNSTSSSSVSQRDSPARSPSISISPPVTASPKDRKSSPEFIELQVHAPPVSPPLPEMTFSPPYSPSSSGSGKGKEDQDEAEESPLLSSSSSSSRLMMTSPPESPRLSPITARIGTEERVWNSPSPSMSIGSSPRRSSFSSIKLPAFLGGGKKKVSPQSTTVSNSPVSPHSPPSPMSSSGSSSRHTRSYPASPLSNSRRISSGAPPPPPPPPPPPALRRSQSPPPLPPKPVSVPVGIVTPLRPVVVEKQPAEGLATVGGEDTPSKPKLKPLHWDKVRASSDREMVWDQLRSSSFKLDEEMIESLFIVNTPNPNQKELPRNPVQPWSKQENRVLDPKKAQNIAILLRALNVTMEEVCEALMEGNAETLGTELLESLLKMAPTKEDERKLMEYKDDSPVKLGHAEKFLKAVINIPFAFKRIEALLYIANFESEVDYLKKSFETLEVACDELRSSRMFLKLLEAVLKTGNRMNVGTNRGDAQAFKLDTLLKLADIKGADGKTTLLHFVVQEIIRTEGQRLSAANNQPSNDESKCRKLGLQVVSSLSSELVNVKKSASMDSDVLSNDVTKLTLGLGKIGEVVRLIDQAHPHESSRRFSESMNKFIKLAEEDIYKVQAQERVALSLVKEITEYFHGNSAKEEAHPFRIFMVVRDFLTVLDSVCKEVSMINERTIVSSAHRFPVPVNPMLPVPVNPFHPQVLPGFPSRRQSSFSDDGTP